MRAQETRKATDFANAERRAMVTNRLRGMDQTRAEAATSESLMLQQRVERDAKRRNRDALRQESGIHASVEADIAKRAQGNARARKASDVEFERTAQEKRGQDIKVQKELTRRAKAGHQALAAQRRQDDLVRTQRQVNYDRLVEADARKQHDTAKEVARYKAHSSKIQSIANRDEERTQKGMLLQRQIEAAQAAKGQSRPFQTLAERTWNDSGQIKIEQVMATRRANNIRKESGDIMRNEMEKKQMHHESVNKAARAADQRTLSLEAKYPA